MDNEQMQKRQAEIIRQLEAYAESDRPPFELIAHALATFESIGVQLHAIAKALEKRDGQLFQEPEQR